MLDQIGHITSIVIVAAAVGLILYDIWAVWRGGAKDTISRLMLTWWTVHPFVMGGVFVLIGHLFFPRCMPALSADLTPLSAALLGVGTTFLIAYEVLHVWARERPKAPVYDSWRFARMIAIAVAGVAVGHTFFGQYVSCA